MASLSAEEKVEFLIQVLATGEFTPNYDALAKRMGINTKSNAQRKLKGIVEAEKKFVLQSNKDSTSVEETGKAAEGSGDDSGEAKKKKATPARGRKRTKKTEKDDEAEESPSKVAKMSPKAPAQDEIEDLTGEDEAVV